VHTAAGEALVINARVDVFVRPRPEGGGDAVDEAVERARRYLEAGADCCYPILAPLGTLPGLVAEIGGPVNAMSRPGGPSLAELTATGVARITFGSSLHQRVTEELAAVARALHAET
jgi:2-methylisocitrate lyase-like PEP mutase family enzyme